MLAGALCLNWRLATPSHDRNWQADYARLPGVEQTARGYRLSNIRNWSYAANGEVTVKEWLSRDIDPNDLVQAYFLVEPFGSIDEIAHTMLGFRLADGEVLVASIEARREVGEVYKPLKSALLPVFEYIFVWTTERDMFGNTEFLAGNQLYLYPLAIPLGQQQAVLAVMLEETARIEQQPRFYNTLFSNCTNVLARTVNRISPGAVPFDISWFLPGLADDFLFREGILQATGSFEETVAAAHVSPFIFGAYDITDPAAFSARIREDMPGAR